MLAVCRILQEDQDHLVDNHDVSIFIHYVKRNVLRNNVLHSVDKLQRDTSLC